MLFEGDQRPPDVDDPFEAFFGAHRSPGQVELTAGAPVEVSPARHRLPEEAPSTVVSFALLHRARSATPTS